MVCVTVDSLRSPVEDLKISVKVFKEGEIEDPSVMEDAVVPNAANAF